MTSVPSNVKKAMSCINSGAISLEKDIFIKHLQTKLEETLTIHYTTVDKLIYESKKSYEYYELCEQLNFSLSTREGGNLQLTDVTEGVADKTIELKRQFGYPERIFKSNVIGEDDFEPMNERSDELLRSERHLSAMKESDNSLWAYIFIILHYIYTITLSFIDVRNWKIRSVKFWSPVFKTAKQLSDASSQTEPPPTRETRIAFTQTTTSAHANTAAQTDSTTVDTIAVQTDAIAVEFVGVQTNAVTHVVVGVQTDATYRRATAVQTDARPCTADASQTDSTAYDVVAVQTDAVLCSTVAVQMNGSTGALTYSTFCQTEWTAEEPAKETSAVQTELWSLEFCETVAVQTEPSSLEFCETVAVQTEPSSAFCKMVAVQTEPLSSSCATAAVQTDPGPGAGTRSDAATQTDLTVAGTRVAANQTDPGDATVVVSAGVQTDEPTCATVPTPNAVKGVNIDEVTELSDKFGRGDKNAAVFNNNRLNLNAVLRKIERTGFKSLCFQELSFLHQKIIDNSMAMFIKYTSLIEIAVKHLPSWHRGSIKQKHDIIHIFAMLDKMMDMKNKEINTYKVNKTG